MSLLRRNNISFWLLIVIIISQIASGSLIWGIFMALLILALIKNRGRLLVLKLPGSIFIYFVLLSGFLIGLMNGENAGTRDYLRDIIYMSSLLLYWWAASTACENENDQRVIITTIFTGCWIIGLINSALRLINYSQVTSNINAYSDFVSVGHYNHYIVAIGIFLAFIKPTNIKKYYNSLLIERVADIILIVSFILSFSRSAILILIIMLVATNRKYLKPIFGILIVGTIGIIIIKAAIPNVYNYFVEKIIRSFTEISTNDNWNDTTIVQNWRGYEVACARKQFLSYRLFDQLFGHGFGTLIDVGKYAFLVTGENALAVLHNGYYTVLIKNGIVGIAFILMFYCSLLVFCFRNLKGYSRSVSMGLIISDLVITTIVMGSFYGGTSFVALLLLAYCIKMSDPTIFY